MKIPYTRPALVGNEKKYIEDILTTRKLAGDGEYTKKCTDWLEQKTGAARALLTTSCTHAMEMAGMLLGLGPADEVLVPSFTFPTSITSFYNRGARPVFVDIHDDTFNIDERLIPEKITERTKSLFLTHYAGIGCRMEEIQLLSDKHGFSIVEDAAQGVNAAWNGEPLGSWGAFGAFSFHDTKDYTCGEGGALLINDPQYIERAEIIREKGTNRSKFLRGEVDKYTWVDYGSSYVPSELLAAFLFAQFEKAGAILKKRKSLFAAYAERLRDLEQEGLVKLPYIPPESSPNYHIFYVRLKDGKTRDDLMDYLRAKGISAVFHFLPLHLSPMGRKLGYGPGDLPVTEKVSQELLRLPLFYDMTEAQQHYVVDHIVSFFKN